jgi:hypothetical protein
LRFSADRMAAEYVAMYRRAIAAAAQGGAGAAAGRETGEEWTTLAP